MISHVYVLSGFHHRLHPIQSNMVGSFVQFSSQTTPGLIGHDSSELFSMYTILVCSITSLSFLVFIPNYTQFDRSRQLSFVFNVNQTYKIGHVIVLSCFRHSRTWSNRSRKFNINFDIYCTYTIGHIVVLFGLWHIWHQILWVMTTQCHFRCRPQLYDRSCHCLVWFSFWQFIFGFGID